MTPMKADSLKSLSVLQAITVPYTFITTLSRTVTLTTHTQTILCSDDKPLKTKINLHQIERLSSYCAVNIFRHC
jgi:hypothetical protein